MNKKIKVILISMVCLLICSVQITGLDVSEKKLRSTIEVLNSNNILAVYSGDYDKDGSEEAFVLIGEMQWELADWRECQAELWFVGESGVQKLEESKRYKIDNTIYRLSQYDFLVLTESYTSHNITNLWGVQNGKPYKEPISGHGGDFAPCETYGEYNFFMTHSCYDAAKDEGIGALLGHTYKKYYFYWNEQEACFQEYGGVKITEEQLLKCEGASEIIDEIKEQGNQIDDIFYRGNQIIHINYSYEYSGDITYKNATLQLEENAVSLIMMGEYEGSLLDSSNQDGIYSAAMIPEIAVFPDELPDVFHQSNYEEDPTEKAEDVENKSEILNSSWNINETVVTIIAIIAVLIAVVEFILILKYKKWR